MGPTCQKHENDLPQRRVILIEDLSPPSVDILDLVSIPNRMRLPTGLGASDFDGIHLLLGNNIPTEVFGQTVGYVYSEPGDTSVSPETKCLVEILDDFGVLPVEIRLKVTEYAEVELTVPDGCPGGTAKHCMPVGRGLGLVGPKAW